MNQSILMAIAALFCTSCLVRILPAVITLPINAASRRYLEQLLPTAVFINFAVYIAYSEAGKAPLAAIAALLFVAVMACTDYLGLLLTTLIATASYIYLVHALQST
jgi:branched-subunit amino acid transport protein AzlD